VLLLITNYFFSVFRESGEMPRGRR